MQTNPDNSTRFSRPHLALIRLIGVIVPFRLRTEWRQEWEAELRFREQLLADWDKLDWKNKLDLWRRSLGAFWDALWLQPKRWEDDMMQDLRFGARMLMKRPGFTFVAVLTLGLGIGANTAIFSLVNTVLLRPLPIAQPEQVVTLNFGVPGRGVFPLIGYPEYTDYRDRNQVLTGLAAMGGATVGLSNNGINERISGSYVTGNYFSLLGVGAALGRVITPEDDRAVGAHPVVVLSYQCWQQRFGADQQILGRELLISGRKFTVIGVAPKGFRGTELASTSELWFPMMMKPGLEVGRGPVKGRTAPVSTIGRLKKGVSWEQAESALNLIAAQIAREYPQADKGQIVVLSQPGLFGAAMRPMVLRFTAVAMGVVVLVLLLACTNLVNMLLSRASERYKEIAIRLALGAGRVRVLRQLLTESVLLALLGSALGLALAYSAVKLVWLKMPVIFGFTQIELQMDWRVLVFTLTLSLLTGVLLGLLPALQATKPDLIPALKNESSFGGYRRSRLRNTLVVAQMSLSLVLLLCAGLVLRGLQNAQQIDPGFNPEQAVEVSFDLDVQQYNRERGSEFQRQVLERVRSLPGLQAAALTTHAPLTSGEGGGKGVFVEGDEPKAATKAPIVLTTAISLDYFRTMETRLLQGRDFTAQDTHQSTPVAIVNEAFVRRFWPGENPIGKRFSFTGATAGNWIEIVGIAQNGKYSSLAAINEPFIYLPLAQNYESKVTLIARSAGDPHLLLATLRKEIHKLDENLTPYDARTMLEHLELPLAPARTAATALGSFGALALLLAAIGIFGVMSNAVTQRTREIGIRIALGADAKEIVKLIVGQGLLLVGIGIAIGLGMAALSTRLLARLLFGVSALDPLTFVGVTVLLAATAFLACYLPACRATKVDPMVALRQD
ncbi:MAG: ABC transporter permease [Acidobacteriota bacterium]|nr:ABC transporter permease [Acidobacteriota bacterium]